MISKQNGPNMPSCLGVSLTGLSGAFQESGSRRVPVSYPFSKHLLSAVVSDTFGTTLLMYSLFVNQN